MSKPNDNITIDFTTHSPTTGALSNADSLPTGTVVRNGTDDGAVTVTVTNKATGRYKAALTVPITYTSGDELQLYIAATVASVVGGGVVWSEVLDSKRVGDLNDIAAGALMGLADDAITASKFDESTAYPLKSADTGATAVARTGADSDTLEILSDEIDAVHTHAAGAETQATTAAARLGAWTGTLRNTVLGAFQALFRSDADATVPSDVNADLGAGAGTAVNTTDSTQAIRDRGDAAWITGAAAPAMITSQEVRDAMKLAPTAGAPAAGSVDKHLDDAMLAASYTAPDNTNIGNIKTVTDKLNTALEADGLVYRYTTNALEQAPAGSGLTAQQTRDAMKLAPTAGAPAAGSIDEHLDNVPLCPCVSATDIDNQLSGVHGAGLWGSSAGVFSVVYTACISGVPTSGIYCRLTADTAGLVSIDAGTSDALGHVTFHHNLPGGTTVYVWPSKDGYEFDFAGLPYDTEVIP